MPLLPPPPLPRVGCNWTLPPFYLFCIRRKSVRFVEAVKRLQSGKEAQGLTLQSFLVLPMQRITRLPLLVNVSTSLLCLNTLFYLTICLSFHALLFFYLVHVSQTVTLIHPPPHPSPHPSPLQFIKHTRSFDRLF